MAGAKRPNHSLRRNAIAIVSVIIALCALGATFWQGSIARDAEQRQLRAYMAVDVLPMKGFEANSAHGGSDNNSQRSDTSL